jgi:competence CoiA-like predicted nuclease
MLIAKQGELRVQASDALAGLDYLCPDPGCHGQMRLRNRKGYVPHFFHLDKARCSNDGESQEHEAAKILLQKSYLDRKVKAELEVYWSDVAKLIGPQGSVAASLNLKAKDRRCDILLNRSAADSKCTSIAVEVQGASLVSSEFDNRIFDWRLLDVDVVWVALLRPSWLSNLTTFDSFHKIEKTTLRNFEHKMLHRYGHIWYIDSESRNFFKGTVASHQLYKNPNDYLDQNAGELISNEGGYYPSARWVDLTLSKPMPVQEVGLKRISRRFKNGVESKIFDWCELS